MSSIIQAAHLELFHEGGFGGLIFKTEMLDDQKSYLVKCDRYAQSINEYAAHAFLRAICLPAPDVRLIRIEEDERKRNHIEVPVDSFGAVEYMAGSVRASAEDIYASGTEEEKSLYSQLLIANRLLDDSDALVEIYQKGDMMFLLDLGETVAGENLLEMVITGKQPYVFAFQRDCKNAAQIREIEPRIKSGKDFCRYFMEKTGTVDEKVISAAASTVLDRITRLNLQNMRECFRDLKEAFGEEIAEGYRMYFRKLRDNCRLIKKYG